MAYKCGLCGAEIATLDEYLAHTQMCVREQKIKEEDVQKMNDDLNRVKAAKKYFEKQLADFKVNYPDAYMLNFGSKDCACNYEAEKKVDSTLESKIKNKTAQKQLEEDEYVNFMKLLLGI